MALGETKEFSLDGTWWRLAGNERVEATRPPDEPLPVMGMDEGLRFWTKDIDPLVGRDAEHPCFATLRFSPSKALRLKLLGASDRVFDDEEGHYVVHGYEASGKPCSLLDCFSGPSTMNTTSGFSSIEVVGNVFVHGAHVASLDELHFQRAELRLTGLREFLTKPLPTSSGERGPGIAGPDGLGERIVEVPGAKFAFELMQLRKRDEYRASFEAQACVRIELDTPASYSGWQAEWVQPLLDLLRFATREPARVESFVAVIRADQVADPCTPDEGWPKALERREIEFILPKSDLLYAGPRHGYRRMLLSAGALGDALELVLARWWKLSDQLGRAGSLLFAMLHSRGYADAQLVTLASVAEAYHRALADPSWPLPEDKHAELVERMLETLDTDEERRVYGRSLRFANSYKQAERIQRVVARAGSVVPELSRKSGRLADRIVDTRNELVHLPVEEDQPLQGRDLVEASELLVLALQVNLLRDLDIAAEHAGALVAESYGQQMLWARLGRRGHAWPKGG